MDIQEHTVVEMLLDICKTIPFDNRDSRIATDHFYTTLDNVYIVKVESEHYLYGKISSGHGSKHWRINKPKLIDG